MAISRRAAYALAPVVFFAIMPLIHGGLPWALSRLGPRYGWAAGTPAPWNFLGLPTIAGGAVALLWIMVEGFRHFAEVGERVELDWRPKVLMTQGPYAFSRNPIYVGELALWLGWAIFYGSVLVLGGFIFGCVVVRKLAVREERDLELMFGERYRDYQTRVPRWLRSPWR